MLPKFSIAVMKRIAHLVFTFTVESALTLPVSSENTVRRIYHTRRLRLVLIRIGSVGINMCRQCFRERSDAIGFTKVRLDPDFASSNRPYVASSAQDSLLTCLMPAEPLISSGSTPSIRRNSSFDPLPILASRCNLFFTDAGVLLVSICGQQDESKAFTQNRYRPVVDSRTFRTERCRFSEVVLDYESSTRARREMVRMRLNYGILQAIEQRDSPLLLRPDWSQYPLRSFLWRRLLDPDTSLALIVLVDFLRRPFCFSPVPITRKLTCEKLEELVHCGLKSLSRVS